jgi:hypothetical protein
VSILAGKIPRVNAPPVHQGQRKPPATLIRSPVIQRDASEARNTATSAMSSGWPRRPSGVPAIIRGFQVAADDAGGVGALGLDAAGRDGIHANVLRCELDRVGARHLIESTLGRAVDRRTREPFFARDRAHVDDTPTFGGEPLHGFFRGEYGSEHVGVELAMELGLGDVFERAELIHAGVVDQDVEAAECLVRLVEMVRNRRRAHVVTLLESAAWARAIRAADLLKQSYTARLGERARDACELAFAELCIPGAFH